MAGIKILVIAEAYERKDGGFRAVALHKETKARRESEVFADRSSAVIAAKRMAYEMAGDRPHRPAYINNKSAYRVNIWVEA